jgi:hypothetical protein
MNPYEMQSNESNNPRWEMNFLRENLNENLF